MYLTDAKILYKPDYSCIVDGKVQYHEAKGFETAVWRIKRRLWTCYGPGTLFVWARQGKSGLVLKETIIPKN